MSTDPLKLRRAPSRDGLVILGLVGRTGSGKSTVARALERDGAVVLDADTLGHEVTDRDPEVRAALSREYGPDAYRPDGTLDRRRVAARVFADPEARARLDRLVHPRILERMQRRIASLRAAGHRGVVVVDAALMLDWGYQRSCDAVIAVVAAEADALARLAAGRGWSRDEALGRLGVQRTPEAFAAAADVTIVNDGSEATLESRVRDAVAELVRATLARKQEATC